MNFQEFQQAKNLRPIADDEIIFDIDDETTGFMAIHLIGINLYRAGYHFEIYYADKQRSPHLHVKDISYLENLTPEQLKVYKGAFIRKYCPPEYLQYADFSLCTKHLIAAENLIHFKHGTIKKLLNVWNEDKLNFAEPEILNQVQGIAEYKPNIQSTGITAAITKAINILDIARQFGLDVHGSKCLCPFHSDNKTPSLVFYESQGRFYCFGCNQNGNIIKFYAMLKELNPKFIYEKKPPNFNQVQ